MYSVHIGSVAGYVVVVLVVVLPLVVQMLILLILLIVLIVLKVVAILGYLKLAGVRGGDLVLRNPWDTVCACFWCCFVLLFNLLPRDKSVVSRNQLMYPPTFLYCVNCRLMNPAKCPPLSK